MAENLRSARRRQGLSQEELAYRADIDRTYVSALERGVYAATIDVLERLARALDMQVWELLKP
ncbi:MAG: helix-turn-helix domain-containing protein [Pseudomonadota bacterium]